MEIRVELKIDLSKDEQFESADYRKAQPMLVDRIWIINQLPTSAEVSCFGKLLRKDGTPTTRRGLVQMPIEDLPEHLLREMKHRGAIQSRIGTVKHNRSSESARQAALG